MGRRPPPLIWPTNAALLLVSDAAPSITRRLTDEEKVALQAIGNAAGGSSLVANMREKQKESFARPLVRPVRAAGVAHVAGGRVPRVRA